MSQAENNPFPYSDTNKRYHTYDYYLRHTFGGKTAKLPLDGGFTCPNKDGSCGVGGCIYCAGGSGEFTQKGSITRQIAEQKRQFSQKWPVDRCIAYFQANTNTYAPIDVLKALYEEALSCENIVGLNIATRADCLASDVVKYLADLSERTTLTVELGLQSSSDKTAQIIRRGHTFECFREGVCALKTASPKIRIGMHLIFGLPNESHEEMMQTVKDAVALCPDEMKIHLLHVLKDTDLAGMYEAGNYVPMERNDYIQTVCDALEIIPPECVLGRLTGDGKKEELLAPLWSLKKTTVLNDIDKELFVRDSWQGKYCKK